MSTSGIGPVATTESVPPEPESISGTGSASALVLLSRKRWFRRLVVWGAMVICTRCSHFFAGPYYLPSIPAILGGIWEVFTQDTINHLGAALVHLVIGFALAALIGIPVGVAMGSNVITNYVVGMYVRALFVTSLVAVLPLLIIIFGYDLAFRVAVVFLFAVFFIILNTAAGVLDVDANLQLMGQAFAIGRFKKATSISIPSALPFIITGLRLGLANAFTGMILAELWVTRGLGLDLTNLGNNRDLPKYFALIIIVTVMAGGSAALIRIAERRLMPWSNAAAAVT